MDGLKVIPATVLLETAVLLFQKESARPRQLQLPVGDVGQPGDDGF